MRLATTLDNRLLVWRGGHWHLARALALQRGGTPDCMRECRYASWMLRMWLAQHKNGQYLTVSLAGDWAPLADWVPGLHNVDQTCTEIAKLYWRIRADGRSVTSASTNAIGISKHRKLGIADPGIVVADPMGRLAKNTAYHLLALALTVGGAGGEVCGGAALLVAGAPALYDEYRKLKGPILLHSPT